MRLQDGSDWNDICKFSLTMRGEQKLIFKALSKESATEWVTSITQVLNRHKLNVDKSPRFSMRDGRRRAVINSSDTADGILTNSPVLKKTMVRYHTIGTSGLTGRASSQRVSRPYC